MVFPIDVVLEDGTTQTVQSEEELEELFEECEDYDGDFEDCFTINYPVTLIFPDASEVSVDSDDALETAIEDYYIANPDEEECPTFAYPIEVTLEDGTVQTINNEEELIELFEECYDDWDGLIIGDELMLDPKLNSTKFSIQNNK